MEHSSAISAIGAVVVCLALVSLGTARESRRFGPNSSTPGPDKKVQPRAPATVPTISALRQGRPIDLNTANATDLELLPAIGPKLATRIVAYRQEHGPFSSVERLAKVSGIGPRKLERIQALLFVTDKNRSTVQEKLTNNNDDLNVKYHVKCKDDSEVSRLGVERGYEHKGPDCQSQEELPGKKIVETENAVSRGVDSKPVVPQTSHPIYTDSEVWDELQDIQ